MRRFIDASKRAATRINARIAGFVVVGLAGAVAVWQGVSYTRPAPKGPTKQIETGMAQPAAPRIIQPAVASLSDDQLSGTSGGNYRLMQYGQVSDSPATPQQPQTNPYLPTTDDPAGGYSSSRAASSRFSRDAAPPTHLAEQPPPASVPSDPTATAPPATWLPHNNTDRADVSPISES